MRIFYKTIMGLCAIAATCGSVYAQTQVANSDFEGDWTDCTPWTFYISEDKFGWESEVVTGITPAGWNISHVSGMTSYYEGEATGLGATEVGGKTEGYQSATAVRLVNTPNPFMAAQIVPAYLSLGKSWSTAMPGMDMETFQFVVNNSDGGCFGGIEFTDRPDGIEFMYKRNADGVKNEGKATVVAYLWKGHWTQKDVPTVVYMAGEPVLKDMTDRDRCILGMDMTGLQGGEVTKTDDAELIAVLTADITDDASEWTKFSGKFEYFSDAAPEMMNIVISAGDYFGGASSVINGNTIIVDNLTLTYGEDDGTVSYPGYLNVAMGDAVITENQQSTLQITKTGDNTCTILLPNLVLNMDGSELPLGDIKVENVTVTEDAGVNKYEGEVKNMQLLGGMIVADVKLNGTSSEGKVNMNIDVMWGDTPIYVSFSSDASGADFVLDMEDAPAEFYNLQGVRVNAEVMAPGIYIKRQGNQAVRVLVR